MIGPPKNQQKQTIRITSHHITSHHITERLRDDQNEKWVLFIHSDLNAKDRQRTEKERRRKRQRGHRGEKGGERKRTSGGNVTRNDVIGKDLVGVSRSGTRKRKLKLVGGAVDEFGERAEALIVDDESFVGLADDPLMGDRSVGAIL